LDEDLERLAGELEIVLEEVDQMINARGRRMLPRK
jgi:hypothetical protein